MKRASNSPLTHFCSKSRLPVRVPRESTRTGSRILTPFHSSQEGFAGHATSLLSYPRPPRCSFRPRLGEGRVRSSLTSQASRSGFVFLSFCFLVVVYLCRPALAAEKVAVKAEVQVDNGGLFLGDIADLKGPDQGRIARLAGISLGPSPQPGQIRTLTQDQVRNMIRTAGWDADVVLAGAPMVQVRLRRSHPRPEEITAAVKAYVVEATSWKEAEIEIRSVGHLEALEVPPGNVTFRVCPKTALSHFHTQLLPLEVVLDGRLIQTAWISAEIGVRAAVLHATRRIPFGKALSAEDVAEAMTDIVDLRGDYVRKYADIAGQVLRRTLSPGDPLTREALAEPVLVRSGDTVNLHVRRNGVSLNVLARAEQSGRRGQMIRVRSLDYLRPLKVQVVAAGEVELQQDK